MDKRIAFFGKVFTSGERTYSLSGNVKVFPIYAFKEWRYVDVKLHLFFMWV
jgi:hypothetical protein